MNEEFLLQAVGHIDEDLIAEAEEYRPAKRPSLRRPLAGLAACLAVVFGLYWGMNNLGMGSANSGSGSAASGESQQNSNSGITDNSQGSGGDVCPAIWVDGQLYWATCPTRTVRPISTGREPSTPAPTRVSRWRLTASGCSSPRTDHKKMCREETSLHIFSLSEKLKSVYSGHIFAI